MQELTAQKGCAMRIKAYITQTMWVYMLQLWSEGSTIYVCSEGEKLYNQPRKLGDLYTSCCSAECAKKCEVSFYEVLEAYIKTE